jgi:ferritin-like metal-binding protein YciE
MKNTTSKSSEKNQGYEMNLAQDSSKLLKLFEEELKDIYWAEKALVKAIPKMIRNASSEELGRALEHHLSETEEHVTRAEQVFEAIGKEPKTKKCEAMDGLIKEAEQIMKESEEGVMLDAGIISAAQKIEHYEIATYGTLRTFAQTLGLEDAATLLEQTLEDEKKADDKLTEIAQSTINAAAAHETSEES